MLKTLDLFSGIGGFSLGLERTGGFKTVAFCEIEPFPRAVLAKHWPEVPCYDDVRTLTAERLAADGISVDVICGGFPCQDISLAAGNTSRAGLGGERSGLWKEFARLIGECGPRWVIVENSPALRVRGADRVLSDLEGLGYTPMPAVVGAIHAGADQWRKRAWIVAYRAVPGLEVLRESEAGEQPAAIGTSGWAAEPGVGRVAYGVPNRVDRIEAIGNAVVPQVVEVIGRAILASDMSLNATRTGPGISRSPNAQRLTVRASTSSACAAATCDSSSASMASLNSSAVISGSDRVDRDLGGAGALASHLGGLGDVGGAVFGQIGGHVDHAALLRAGHAELEARLHMIGLGPVSEGGGGDDVHGGNLGPMALGVNRKGTAA